MRDYIDVGPNPPDEVLFFDVTGSAAQQKSECRAFIQAIRQTLGPEPEGAQLRVKGNQHDFGTYYEVVCYYDTDSEEAMDYAFRCESDSPANWPKSMNVRVEDGMVVYDVKE